ncbi:MAG: HEPN domain-containing protein [Candidatus Peribacteraceae bacterium]|nr:HEPN domain-containing protein [Candidatus Peribacteraceae bacterium]
MTEADVIAHWRQGARDALRMAHLAHGDGRHALTLFHCHLAVEKAMKSLFMQEKKKEAPPTHNLVFIAEKLKRPWSGEERRQLTFLTQYAVAARYDDPVWAEHEATAENGAQWIAVTEKFLSSLLP